MLSNILLVLVVLIIAVLLYASTRPNTLRIERSANIKASPEKIFPMLNDFRNWAEWSPWEKLDPALKRTHSGPAAGVGAVYEWEGNKKVGKGRMEITDVTPPSRVALNLHFIAPWEARNTTVFALTPSGGSTNVSWVMEGPNTFMGKVMGVFMNMDKMVGSDFEKGLANMKALAER